MLQIGRSLVRSQLVLVDFSLTNTFRSHYGPGVDTASNRNEYQEYFLGGKGGRCLRLTTLPPYCAIVTKSGNLNFLEPSGPLQACNGTAFYQFTNVLFLTLPTQKSLSFMYLKYCVLFVFCKDILNTKHYTSSGLDQR